MADKPETTTARAIVALLLEPTIEQAARSAGISQRTLYRWLRDDEFIQELRAASGAAIEVAVNRIRGLAGKALMVLEEAMGSEEERVRVQAAGALLSHLDRLQKNLAASRLAPISPDTCEDEPLPEPRGVEGEFRRAKLLEL